MRKNRTFLKLLAMAVVLATLWGCTKVQPPLKVARHIWPGYELMYLAESLGRIDPGQVEFVQTATAPDTLQLLLEGRVDGGALTLDEVLRAHEQGVHLVAVLIFDISAGADVLLADSAIDSLPALKGKRIGVETGAVGAIMLDRALHAAGLTAGDVEVVPLRLDEQIMAWQQQRIDAIITYEPNASQIRASGARELFTSRDAPNLIVDVLAFRPEALERTAAIQHVVDSHFYALRHFQTNAVDAYYRLAPRLDVEAEQVNGMFNGLVLPSRDFNKRLLAGSSARMQKHAQQLLGIMRAANMLTSEHDHQNTLFDGQFVSNSEP